MEILEWLRALDPRAMAMFAVLAAVGIASDRVRVGRARRRVEDYLRMHRYTVKSIRRSWRPHVTTTGTRHAIHFELEVYDLEFDTRRRGWASASSSTMPMYEDGVRVEWEGEPEAFGSALPPLNERARRE